MCLALIPGSIPQDFKIVSLSHSIQQDLVGLMENFTAAGVIGDITLV